MALPNSIDKSTPGGGASPGSGDDELRALKLFLQDVFGIPDATNITVSPIDIAAGGAVTINPDGGDADFIVEGDTNTTLINSDAGQDATSFGGANVDGAATTFNNLTDRTAVTSVGAQIHMPAQTQNFDNASGTIAIGAAHFIGIPTWTNDSATLTVTDLATLHIQGAPVDSTNVTGTNKYALVVDGGASRLDGPLYILEQADADGDRAGYGQLWVNTATPNELYFTDDAGTDFQLGAGVSASSTNTWTADQTYNDDVNITLGTGGDADLDYDGTNVILDSSVVGSGKFILAPSGNSRTATVHLPCIIRSVTSGTPAAGIGTGIQFDAESGDENPSVLGSIDFSFTDVSAGSEDSEFNIQLRVAGSAAEDKYTFKSTAGSGYVGIFTHAATADRTWTLPDSTGTLAVGTIPGGANALQLNDSVAISLGTGSDATLQYDGTNLRLVPDAVGAGGFSIDSSSTPSSAVDDGQLNINSTNATAAGVIITTHHNSASPGDNDEIMRLVMFADDSGGTPRRVGQIACTFQDVTSTSMDSAMFFKVMNNVNAGDINTLASLTKAGVWTDAASFAELKTYEDVFTPADALAAIKTLHVGRYRTVGRPDNEKAERHIGPTADEFYDACKAGTDPRVKNKHGDYQYGIAAHDMAGIAMMAVQSLLMRVERLEG